MRGRILGTSAGLVAAMALVPALASGATIKVNGTTDGLNGNKCGLREAVESANTNSAVGGCAKGQGSQRDVIELKGEEYTLSIPSTDENANTNGDLDVTDDGPVTIKGKGGTQITQAQNDRVVDVQVGADVTLQNLRLTGGDVTSFISGHARGGNARVSSGKLTLNKVDSTSADAFVGGSVHASDNSKLTIKRSFFENNDATGSGGTLSVQSSSKATVKATTMQLSDVVNSTSGAHGGVILSEGGALTVLDSTIQGSSIDASGVGHEALGAGIYSSAAKLTVKRTTIQGNTASAAQDNTQEHGGGIYTSGQPVTIVNSTFLDNRAGGGGDNDGMGGAIFINSGHADVKNVTLDANNATLPSGGDAIARAGGTLDLFGSILNDQPDACAGTGVSSSGFNVLDGPDDADCNLLDSDVPNGDTDLLSIGDNGGPTPTIPIAGTSDAKNLIPKSKCKKATGLEDQRGFVRPKGKKCDAGAFELGAKK